MKKKILLLVALFCMVSGCTPPGLVRSQKPSDLSMETEVMGRANPGYVQWLEKQAMLTNSEKLSSVVSGTNLFWLGPYEKPRVDMMLNLAPVWVTFDAARTLPSGTGTVVSALQSEGFLKTMKSLGVRGIHIRSMRESGAIWGSPTEQRQLGDDTVSYLFSKGFGDERGFNEFLRKANKHGMIVGDATIPFATGRGADYFLSARGVESYKGLYCMVEVPREYWKHLPQIETRTRAVPVDDAALKTLRGARILPPPLVRESLPLSVIPLNWYATDVVQGLDGNGRRFVYLGYGSESRPVLNWNDPSKSARRVISGSLIQEIGMLHAAMTSVSVAPLYGLEPAYPNAATSGFGVGDTAVQAARDIAQEARRYGGWTFLEDNLPLPDLKAATEGGVDFVVNHALATSAEYAYATGDATLLAQTLFTTLQMGIDQKRFIHRIQPEPYINFSFPFMANPQQKNNTAMRKRYLDTVRGKLATTGGDVYFSGDKLYLTPAGFVASVQGIRKLRNLTDEQRTAVTSGLTLLGHTQAMQPGIFMFSADELLGILPLKAGLLDYVTEEDALRQNVAGGYDITSRGGTNILTEIGLPKAQTVFDDLDSDVRMAESFAGNMRRLIKLRNALGMQNARVVQLPKVKNKGVLIQVFQLPPDNSLKALAAVTVINFGETEATETFSLLQRVASGDVLLEEGITGEVIFGAANQLSVTVPARTAQTYIVKSGTVAE